MVIVALLAGCGGGGGSSDLPMVIDHTPRFASGDVSRDTLVTATFSHDMNPATVNSSSFYLTGPGGRVDATVSYAAKGAVLDPVEPLDYSTTYTATVTRAVKSTGWTPIAEEAVWNFTTTDGASDVLAPPTVAARSPDVSATGVPVGASVTATFSEPLYSASVNTSTFTLTGPSGAVEGAVNYLGQVATFTPRAPLLASTTYTATLETGITDLAWVHLPLRVRWTFTTEQDVTPPTVTTLTPSANAVQVPLRTSVDVRFSEQLASGTINSATFHLTGPLGDIPGHVSSNNANGNAYASFTPSARLEEQTTYTATLETGITDLAGNHLAERVTWSFTTEVDLTPPTVRNTTPNANATGVSLWIDVSAFFSEMLDPATISGAVLTLTGPSGAVEGTVEHYYSGPGTAVTFDPSAPLAELTLYTATLETGITDLEGNHLAERFSWSFTTGDFTAPTVTSKTPAASATGVELGAAVTAVFSEPLDPATVNAANFTLAGPSGAVAGSVSYAEGIATFTPVAPLAYYTTYTASLKTGITDVYGNSLASQATWAFTTEPDLTPLTVTSLEPAANATRATLYDPVRASFSKPLLHATVNDSTFTLTGPSGAVTGTVSHYNYTNGATASFTPSARLAEQTTYTATLETGITGLAGNPMAERFSWSFTTGDFTEPFVTSKTPAASATGVPVGVAVTATFSEPLDPATVNAANFTLTGPSGAVAGSVSYAGGVAAFTPSSPLAYSTTYTAKLDNAIKDLAGNNLYGPPLLSVAPSLLRVAPLEYGSGITVNQTGTTLSGGTSLSVGDSLSVIGTTINVNGSGPVTWSFTTEAAPPDVTPPTATTLTPGANATQAQLRDPVRVDFSEPLDPARVNTANFTLTGPSGAVTGSVSYAGGVATFTPSAPLAESTIYTAALETGITDLSGNHLAERVTWSFTTGDFTQPTVTSKTPAASATGVPVGALVTATFSEPLDPATVNAANFTLTGPSGAVAGAVSYVGGIATFTPASQLAYSTTYTAKLGTGITDLAGNHLAGGSLLVIPLAYGNSLTLTQSSATLTTSSIIVVDTNPPSGPVTWSFTTAAPSDVTPPTVVDSTSYCVSCAPVTTSFSITFSEAIDPSSVNASTLRMFDHYGTVSGTYTATNNLVTFTPDNQLNYSDWYTIYLAGVKDLSGNVFVGELQMYLGTEEAPDTNKPIGIAAYPSPEETNVPARSNVFANFSEWMDIATITGETFTLSGPSGAVGGVVTADSMSAVFTPTSQLSPGATYTATLKRGIKDEAGNELVEEVSWSFNVTGVADAISPYAVSIYPEDGSNGIDVFSQISINFSEIIDPSSIDSSNFTISCPSGPIAGKVTVDGVKAAFTPKTSLASSTQYTVTVGGGIKDIEGNEAAQPITWQFTTQEAGTWVRLVSRTQGGVSSNRGSWQPSLSADGRYIAFISASSNLVQNFTGCDNLFIADIMTGTIEKVDLPTVHPFYIQSASDPAISADGLHLAYVAAGSKEFSFGQFSLYNSSVYSFDRVDRTTVEVSLNKDGTTPNEYCEYPAISADGRYIAYYSEATDIVDDVLTGFGDIFVKDMVGGQTTLASISTDGTPSNQWSAFSPDISGDGTRTSFPSWASNFSSNDTNGFNDAYYRDFSAGVTELASVSRYGEASEIYSIKTPISLDGRFVAFDSYNSNIVTGDTNNVLDVFIMDTFTDVVSRVSTGQNGEEANHSSYVKDISGNGRYVLFLTQASNLVPGNTDQFKLVVHDMATGNNTLIAIIENGDVPEKSSISADGRWVVFTSWRRDIILDDVNLAPDIFLVGPLH